MPTEKKVTRQPMPERPVEERIRDFDEVPEGYTPEMARIEASRCLQCRKPPCVEGCPVRIDIPAFVRLVAEGRFLEAGAKLKEETALPAVCGRVCPQETQCEEVCVLARKGQAVAIGALERFAADCLRDHGDAGFGGIPAASGSSVAIVGAGPAGLTAAGELAKMGHKVVVFEALHAAGGVLMYGIPEFRLPKRIVQAEVEDLKSIGVGLHTDIPVGRALTVEELLEEFDAVFIGAGAGLPRFLGLPGENLVGVLSANEYLTRVNLMRAWDPESPTPVLVGKHTVVLGGGNVALDCARSALRVGGGKVTLLYRRTRAEMPARAQEVHHAGQEGINFGFLTSPVEFLGNDKARLTGIKCLRMELGEPDESGRRRPVPIPGSEHVVATDLAIVAIGNSPNPIIATTTPGLTAARHGGVETDPETGATSLEGVFAGGDIATGAATVIEAMGAAKRAAAAIDQYLQEAGCADAADRSVGRGLDAEGRKGKGGEKR
ncbi:MAG: NADPH-dependent glutamate synthase [Planctomycetes bacterium]|nr:NADPH-dependent glutamate synthase [Planctomycetota bacterium]